MLSDGGAVLSTDANGSRASSTQRVDPYVGVTLGDERTEERSEVVVGVLRAASTANFPARRLDRAEPRQDSALAADPNLRD